MDEHARPAEKYPARSDGGLARHIFARVGGTRMPGGPLYLSLRRDIEQAIDRGLLTPGDALPSEREIASIADVSRVTVRKAVQAPSVQVHGRVGRARLASSSPWNDVRTTATPRPSTSFAPARSATATGANFCTAFLADQKAAAEAIARAVRSSSSGSESFP